MSAITKFNFYLIFLCLTLSVKAQNTDSIFRSLTSKLKLNDTASHSDLFLHFDKNVYTANENVWFAAYLMHTSNFKLHHTLYVTLVNEMDHSVVASYQFALDGGLASGSMALQDSLETGKYCFIAYTNKSIADGTPHIFRQPVDILGRKRPFALQIMGSYEGDNISFTCQFTKKAEASTIPGDVSYSVIADGQLYKQFGQKMGVGGEVKFSIPSALAFKSLEIAGRLGQGKEQMAFRRPLAWPSAKNLLKFSPAGGELTAGQPSQVAFTAQNTSGQTLSRSCILLEDNTQIASFTTDKQGNGFFTFTPKIQKQYLVKFKDDNETPVQRFPDIKVPGWSILPQSTIVSDTLRLAVSKPGSGSDCVLLIHNNHSMLYGAYLRLRNPALLLKIPVADWGAGIAHVCLYTKDGILQEERLVLVKQQERISASLKTDSAIYKPLSKISVKLKLTNSKGEPLKGLFSFSCALEQATTAERKNIEVYDLFERFLPDRSLLPPWEALQDEQNIKAVLLKQENVMADTSFISVFPKKPGLYDGYVLHNNKKPKKTVDMMLAGSQTAMFSTDGDGRFIIPYQPLRADAGKNFLLTVLGKNQSDYKIEMASPLARVNTSLANQDLLHTYLQPDELSDEQRQVFASSKTIMLKDVTISSKKEDPGNFYGKANESGVCNDWVCKWEVLNCLIHPPVKKPIEGHLYNFETLTGVSPTKVIYHCPYQSLPSYIRSIPATVTYTSFAPFNPSEPNLPEFTNNTTLHWQAFIETDEKGEATISFHNNARNGRFKAEVQGLVNNGVFTSQVYFEVKQ